MKSLTIGITILLLSNSTHTFAQGNVGGGSGEPAYHAITSKITPWLQKHLNNGSLSSRLHLEENKVKPEDLVAGYKDAVKKTIVKFIMEKDLEKECKNGDNIACLLNNSSRTCISLRDDEHKLYKTECREEMFLEKTEKVQFVINLHEYLFISKLEETYVDHSLYPISNYLSNYARPKIKVEYDLTDDIIVNPEQKPECEINLLFNGDFSVFKNRSDYEKLNEEVSRILNEKGYVIVDRKSLIKLTTLTARDPYGNYIPQEAFQIDPQDNTPESTKVLPELQLTSMFSLAHVEFGKLQLKFSKRHSMKKFNRLSKRISIMHKKSYKRTGQALRKVRLAQKLRARIDEIITELREKNINLVLKMMNQFPRCE